MHTYTHGHKRTQCTHMCARTQRFICWKVSRDEGAVCKLEGRQMVLSTRARLVTKTVLSPERKNLKSLKSRAAGEKHPALHGRAWQWGFFFSHFSCSSRRSDLSYSVHWYQDTPSRNTQEFSLCLPQSVKSASKISLCGGLKENCPQRERH